MRPLEHYGVGPYTLDGHLLHASEETYDMLSDRGERLLEELRKEFLGEYYNPPKKSFKELIKQIDEYKKKIPRLEQLKVPQFMIDDATKTLENLEKMLAEKDFISFSDHDAIEYKRRHDALNEVFNHSKEKRQLLLKIYEYNDVIAREVLGEEIFTVCKDDLDTDFINRLLK